jgi:hypothetical protein
MLIYPDLNDFVTLVPLEQARREVTLVLQRQGGVIKVNSGNSNSCLIVARFGSGFKRIVFGISLAGIKCIPRWVVFELRIINDKTVVSIKVRKENCDSESVNFIDWCLFQLRKNSLVENWPDTAAAAAPPTTNEFLQSGLDGFMYRQAIEIQAQLPKHEDLMALDLSSSVVQ